MSMYRFSLKHHTRSGQGAPSAQHTAYVLREQEYAPTKAHVEYVTRTSPMTRSREDLVHAEWHNLPAWAENNPTRFFHAADQCERLNARVSSTLEIALPRELPRDQQIMLMQDFCASQFPSHPYAVGFHESPASDGLTNPHFHVVYSERVTDGVARTPEQHFKRYNRAHPERGGAQKDPLFHARGLLRAQRQAWSDLANFYLERAGVEVRLDPRSLQDRGIDRDPEARLAPYHSTQAKYQGRHTPQWQATLVGRQAREDTQGAEHLKAQAYWAKRREVLCITPEMRRETLVAETALRTRTQALARPGFQSPPTRGLSEHETAQLTTYAARLRAEITRHDHYAKAGKVPTPAMQSQARRLLAQGEALGCTLEPEEDVQGVHYTYHERGGYGY